MADDQTTGSNPPRPGDPVPTEGLDPTMVFASQPTPPQPPAQQGDDGSGDDSAVPPQDSGPPPPPPGTVATKEMGYDDEDIRVLGEVGDYRFGSITVQLTNDHITIPAHPETVFDEQMFMQLLRGAPQVQRALAEAPVAASQAGTEACSGLGGSSEHRHSIRREAARAVAGG